MWIPRRKLALILLVGAVAFGLGGCGSGTKEDSSAGISSAAQESSSQPESIAVSSAVASDSEPTSSVKSVSESTQQKETVTMIEITMKDGGVIKLELDSETAPLTTENFVSLVNDEFYDGLIFHRVIADFMIQGGDPDGTGMGGPGHSVKGEFASNGWENNISHKRGVISMARSNAPDSAGSQFFITHGDSLFLDGGYAAFGTVVEGMDVVDRIAAVKIAAADRPVEDVVIETIRVVE